MSAMFASRPDRAALAPGAPIDVRTRYLANWSSGFEIISVHDDEVHVRRLSDGGELPLLFSDDDVRKEKKRGTWWY